MFQSALLEGIGSGKMERIVMAKIKADVDLLEAIKEVAHKERIEKGIFLTGIGALKKAIFRNLKVFPQSYPITPKDRLYLEIEKPLELVSLTGHIALNEKGEPDIHAHFSASTVVGDTVVTLGGHLTEGTVTSVKVAIAIGVIEGISMRSKIDPEKKAEDLFIE